MGALQQIIAERSKAIPTSGRAEIAEKKSLPPQRPSRTSSAEPSRPRGQSQTPPPRQHRGESDELDDWLGPWWQDREKLAPQFKDALTNFRPIQIRNFLKYDKAIALHDELYASDSWDVYESFNRWYQFHFKAIYMSKPAFHQHRLLKKISTLMSGPIVNEWIRDISASEVNGTTITGASYYQAGDYTMPHTDKAGGSNTVNEKRRVAFILHLTKAWNPKFGGDMVWMNPSYHFHPSFNSMTFFAVSKSSWHFVSPVAAITPDHIKRLAFSGWWTSTNIRQADQIEEKANDDLRQSTFATVLDGKTSRLIPHMKAYEALEGLWPELVDV